MQTCRCFKFVLLILVLQCFSSTTFSQDAYAQETSRPNILIAISDDQSFPYASAYGSKTVHTPHFDRVAKAGVLFTNAFAASPGCSPSRAALLTGRYPWQLEHAGTHASYFSTDYVVFPDLLEASGYAVGFTGKGWGPGNWSHSGRTRNPAGNEYNQHKVGEPVEGINAKDYAKNFEQFLGEKTDDQPFYFWYGAHEPHRVFKDGIGKESGKQLHEAEVPSFLPDHPIIKSDILDYAYEIEHFDDHLGKMLALLEAAGELENTLIIITSDNGMAFPRAKANAYEFGIHVPLAVMWPSSVPGQRTSHDLVSLTDLAPTILEATGTNHPSPASITGKSMLPLLTSNEDDRIAPSHRAVFSARERHSSSRFNSLSYSQRALRKDNYLLIRNFNHERWPAGAPQKFNTDGSLGPMHGGYHDIDAAPALSYLVDNRDDPTVGYYFHLAVDLRPAVELYDIKKDPGCLINLAGAPGYIDLKNNLQNELEAFLIATNDPRITGEGDIFETYPRVSRLRTFPEPPWARSGKDVFRPEWLDR